MNSEKRTKDSKILWWAKLINTQMNLNSDANLKEQLKSKVNVFKSKKTDKQPKMGISMVLKLITWITYKKYL